MAKTNLSTTSLDATVVIGCCNIVEEDGAYLLVRESKPSARSRYNLPAGKPEVGESLVEAAVREAKEESGLDVEVDRLIGIYHCSRTTEGFGVVNFVFASHVVGGVLTESAEHPEVRYFSKSEITELAAGNLVRGAHIQLAIRQTAMRHSSQYHSIFEASLGR